MFLINSAVRWSSFDVQYRSNKHLKLESHSISSVCMLGFSGYGAELATQFSLLCHKYPCVQHSVSLSFVSVQLAQNDPDRTSRLQVAMHSTSLCRAVTRHVLNIILTLCVTNKVSLCFVSVKLPQDEGSIPGPRQNKSATSGYTLHIIIMPS